MLHFLIILLIFPPSIIIKSSYRCECFLPQHGAPAWWRVQAIPQTCSKTCKTLQPVFSTEENPGSTSAWPSSTSAGFLSKPESQPNPPAHLQKLQLWATVMIVTWASRAGCVLAPVQQVQRNASLVSLYFSTPFFPHRSADTVSPTALKSLRV